MADGILELLPLDISENSYINGMAAMEDGNLAIIVNNSTYDLDENGEPVNWQDSMEMWKISGEDGAMLDSIPMDGILGDENTYINSMCIDGQGNRRGGLHHCRSRCPGADEPFRWQKSHHSTGF